MLLQIQDVSRSIGERTLFSDLSFQVHAGDRLGLVGPNGAGKSTLLRMIAGDEPADGGKVSTPRGVHVALLRQEIDPRQEHSVHEEASSALGHLDQLEADLHSFEEKITRLGETSTEIPTELAERYHLHFLPFILEGVYDKPELMLNDGLHPSAPAQPLILDNIWRVLQPLLEDDSN